MNKSDRESREQALQEVLPLIPATAEALVFCQGRIAKRQAPPPSRGTVTLPPGDTPAEQHPAKNGHTKQQDVAFEQRIHEFNTLLFRAVDGNKWWNDSVDVGKSAWTLAIGESFTRRDGQRGMVWSQYVGFDSVPTKAIQRIEARAARIVPVGARSVYVVGVDKEAVPSGSVCVFQSGRNSIGLTVELDDARRLCRSQASSDMKEKATMQVASGQIRFRDVTLPFDTQMQAWGVRVYGENRDRVTTEAFGDGAKWLVFSFTGGDAFLDVQYCDRAPDTGLSRIETITHALFDRQNVAVTRPAKGVGKARVKLRASLEPADGVTSGEACLGIWPLLGMPSPTP